MLERASSCLESAAQNLFRSIEAPTRSQRRLPQAFWRHTRNSQQHTSWWPAYLDDIRRAVQAREEGNDAGISGPRLAAGVPPFTAQQRSLVENANSKQKAHATNRRHISKIVKQSRLKEEKALQEALEPEDEVPPPAEVALFAPEGIPEPRKLTVKQTTAQRLEALLRAGGEPKYNEVWLTFISLKEQAGFARAVLRYLSRSSSPVVLRRALRTFQMIEVEDRTHLTYESAVRAGIGLRKYGTAIKFVLQALQRGLGVQSSQFLMGHLIEKDLWKFAVRALHVFVNNTKPSRTTQITTNKHVIQHMRESPIWKTVDGMLSLPEKLIRLSKRLKENDAVLASDRVDIEHLATRLLERALRSTTIMGIITAEGILTLFDNFRSLGLLRQQHYLDALSALRVLRNTRNRSQLALLIFRNMRWVNPTYHFKTSTYGTMISILSGAPNDPTAFEYIFQDVTLAHDSNVSTSTRKVDLAMYQRVISACAEQGHVTYVKQLLKRVIRDHGVQKDLAFFTPLLLSSAKRGDIKATRESFHELSATYKLEPNQRCWNIFLLAFAKADDFQGAAALFRQMSSLGVAPDAYTFGTLMSMCSNSGDTRALLQLVEMARKQQIPASTAMLDTIVHSYCMNEEVNEAESLVEAATRMDLPGSPTRMWNILLRHYAFRANSTAVLRIQERMRELAVKPDGMTYAALMTSLVVIGKTKDAAAILRSLHLSQIVTASRFHYSIVLHGYVGEGQRDQAMVIYAEMLERFGRPSPSAQLAILRLQSQRDELQARNQEAGGAANWYGHVSKPASPLQKNAIDFLADALLEMADNEALSNEPQPGFQRRNPISAGAGAFLEVPAAVLSLSSSYEKAQKLVGRFQAFLDASTMSKQQKSFRTMQLLTAQMRGLVRSYEGSGKSTAHLTNESHARLDAIWTKILAQTLSHSRERWLGLIDDDLNRLQHKSSSNQVPGTPSDGAVAKLNLPLEPDVRIQSDCKISLADIVANIIPAKRYALSVPLSVYMRGLALQQRHSEIECSLKRLQEAGFELTSKNWNTYLQLLSERQDTILQGFRLFEQNMLPNTPSWEQLKRGQVSSSNLLESLTADGNPSESGKNFVSRTTVEKRHPGQLVPTYFTVIHLAAAFIKAYHAQSGEGDRDQISLYNELRRQAPGTVKYIQAMPLLKDRVQGVLLRGRAVKGDFEKRPREPQLVDRAGLLGSRSLLSWLSSETLDKLEETKRYKAELQSLVEEIRGPIVRNTLVTARRRLPESPKVQEQRIRSQETKQESLKEQLRTEIEDKAARLIATDTDGDKSVAGLSEAERVEGLRRSTLPTAPETETKTSMAPPPHTRLLENAENLRRMAAQPERPRLLVRIKSTRRRQIPRILAFPSKSEHKTLLRPQGGYKNKSQLFTKSMLTMRVPRRRLLGSEHRAFDLPKKYMDLKKERERNIRKAQARARKIRKFRENWWDEEGVRVSGRELEGGDAAAFLEERLVVQEARDERVGVGEGAELGMRAGPGVPVDEQQQQLFWTAKGPAPRAATEHKGKAQTRARDKIAPPINVKVKEEKPDLEARLADPNAFPAEDAAKSNAGKATESLVPWGVTGAFDAKDFEDVFGKGGRM